MKGVRFDLARVTIEATTPLTVGTGGGNDLSDAVCVTDANGLPCIPGTSLAGALRHAMTAQRAQGSDCNDLFGFQDLDDGKASRIAFSWAQVHGVDDRPVPFRGQRIDGPVLSLLAAGVMRDHVRLDRRGVVDNRGKFDETLVPTGSRFTFEIRIALRDDGPADELPRVLGLLARDDFRIGGRTRRGFGRIRLVRCRRRLFDLRRPADRDAFLLLPSALNRAVPADVLPDFVVSRSDRHDQVTASVLLAPEDFWMFGRGEPDADSDQPRAPARAAGTGREAVSEKPADIIPVTEPCIVWDVNRGATVSRRLGLVPGSGVKGALRHRMEFHLRRLLGAWAPVDGSQTIDKLEEPDEIKHLFGAIKDRGGEGVPGCVYISDVHLTDTPASGLLQHVSLDRFTGAPIDGALFSEAPFWKGAPVEVQITVDTARLMDRIENEGCRQRLREALRATLVDLCEGRLALGAAASRGHGYFTGRIEWSDGGRWMGGAS